MKKYQGMYIKEPEDEVTLKDYPPVKAILRFGGFEMLYTLPSQVMRVDVPTEFGMWEFEKTESIEWREHEPYWVYQFKEAK